MIEVTQLKGGKTFLLDNVPHIVAKYEHIKTGRGGGNVRLTVRNLKTGDMGQQTYPTSARFDEISTYKRPLQYLYSDGVNAEFMDEKTFEQIEIPISILGNDILYLKEGQNVTVLFWEEKALSVDIPPKVTLKVVQTDPGVKGNSTTNIYKPAKLENGLELKVPLFVKVGEKIRVDTRTGEYIERAGE